MKASIFPCWLAISSLTAFAVLHAQSDISVGSLSGDIKFISPSADIAAQIANDPPVAGGQVRATNLQTAQLSSVSYSPTAGGLPAVLAHYEMTPVVGQDGARFNVYTDPFSWFSGALYRFGSSSQTSLSALLTTEIATATHPVVFDIQECPALCRATVRICGDQSMLDQILGAVEVTVSAEIRSGGVFSEQARSAVFSGSAAELQGTGLEIPLILRGGGTVRFRGQVKARRSITNVPQSFSFTSAPLTVNCGQTVTADLCPEVEFPPLGTLLGKVDLVGAGCFAGTASHSPSAGNGSLTSLAINTLLGPPFLWAFPLLDSGIKNVTCTVIAADKLRMVTYPRIQDVEVAAGQTTDLANSFVVKPFTVHTSVTLRDPSPDSSLTHLFLGTFESVNVRARTRMAFTGLSGFVALPDGSQGADGSFAISEVALRGTLDAGLGEILLTGDALLPGINSPGGTTDGTSAVAAGWKVGNLSLGFTNTAAAATFTSEDLLIGLRNAQTFVSTPGGEATMLRPNVCFGEFRRRLRCPTNKLFSPSNSISSNSASPGLDDLGNPLSYTSVSGGSRGNPAQSFNALNEIVISIALPAFRSHDVTTTCLILPASGTGQPTSASLPPFQTGSLECGELIEVDTTVDPGGQIASEMWLQIETPPEYCDPAGVVIGLRGEAVNQTITKAEVKLGSGPFVAVCGTGTNVPCTNPLEFDYQFPGSVPVGQHFVEARITDGSGHTATVRKLIHVHPVQPVIVCPAPFTVYAEPGLTTVPLSAVASRLVAGFDFGCASAPATMSAITNNAPNTFPLGRTDVIFSTPDDGTPTGNLHCLTTVTVQREGDCASLENHAPGDLAAPVTLGGATFRRSTILEPKNARFKTETGPPSIGQVSSLLVSGGVVVTLPFPCKRFFITYVKGNSSQVKVLGANSLQVPRFGDWPEQLVFRNPTLQWTSPVDELEWRRRTHTILSDKPVTRLRISGSQGELMLLRLCYQRD